MKIVHHIPTEQFGFTEVETEDMTYDEAKSLYGANLASGEGLEVKVFNASLDEYLLTNTLKDGTNLYEKMSAPQQAVFQEIKKSLKRIKAKQE